MRALFALLCLTLFGAAVWASLPLTALVGAPFFLWLVLRTRRLEG